MCRKVSLDNVSKGRPDMKRLIGGRRQSRLSRVSCAVRSWPRTTHQFRLAKNIPNGSDVNPAHFAISCAQRSQMYIASPLT